MAFKKFINKALLIYLHYFDPTIDINKDYQLPKLTFETLEYILKNEDKNILPLNIENLKNPSQVTNIFVYH